MRCPSCNYSFPENLAFCPKCGHSSIQRAESDKRKRNAELPYIKKEQTRFLWLIMKSILITILFVGFIWAFWRVIPICIDYRAAEQARLQQDYQRAAALYSKHPGFRDSEEKAQLCLSKTDAYQASSLKTENVRQDIAPSPAAESSTTSKTPASEASATALPQETEPQETIAPTSTPAPTEQPSLPLERVVLEPESIVIEVGTVFSLSVSLYPENSVPETIQWNTSDPAIITVSDGLVTAIGAGFATVTANTESGLSASCEVMVIEYPSGLQLSTDYVELSKGQSVVLTAEIMPETATERDIVWSSSDPDIATVSEGTVTAFGSGSATITAETANGITATVTVKVPKAYRLETVASETMDEDDYLVVDNQGAVIALFSDYSGYDKKSTVKNLTTGETLDLSTDLPLLSNEGNPYRSTMLYDAHMVYDRYNGRLYVLGNSDADAKTAMVIYDITDLNDPFPLMCYSSSNAIQNKDPIVVNPASENNPKKTYVLSDGSFLIYLNSDRESVIKPSKDTIGRCAYDLVVGDYSIQYRFDSETFIRTDLSTGTEKTVYFSGETPPELTEWEQVFPGMESFYFWSGNDNGGLYAYDLSGKLSEIALFSDIDDLDHLSPHRTDFWRYGAAGCDETVFAFYDAENHCIRRLSRTEG